LRAIQLTWLAAALVTASCGGATPPESGPASPGPGDARYVAVAETLQRELDGVWSEERGRYDPPGLSGTVAQTNANLLLVHATAARLNLSAPLRDDARARRIVAYLTGPLAWTGRPLPDAPPWIAGPGWRAAPNNPNQHLVFSAEVAEGLAAAHRAQHALQLEPAAVAAIADQIARTAASPDFAWPALRLNQLNWHVALFAADAQVNGATRRLADGLAQHLERFAGGALAPPTTPNLGPGLRFRYLPERPAGHPANFDSAEYANIVLGFSRHYAAARAAGMPAPARLGLLRDWARRAISGYWAHTGYLNWDTGLGFGRWHQTKKVPLAQAALLGIATTPELQPGPEWGAWAKAVLDAGLDLYADEVAATGALPPGVSFGLTVVPQGRANAYLTAARYAGNAMRALDAGLGRAPSQVPPALYAFDADTGRLAVTTPAYSTAIVAVNHRAFPYGGLDLTRLLDARRRPVGGIGGVAPATFGLQVVGADGRIRLRTAYGRAQAGSSPLRLTHAPPVVGAAQAGPFTALRVRGEVRSGRLRATAAYRFTATAIKARWTVHNRARGDRAQVTFPSWGGGTRLHGTLRDGRRVRLSHTARADVVTIDLAGYRVRPLHPGARVRIVRGRRSSSAPEPGPTLVVDLPARTRSLDVELTLDGR
jgi:hypothetical protein